MIETIPLFPVLHDKLIALLRSLSPEDWHKPTLARQWTVKDIVAHLLDGDLRVMSFMRDGHSIQPDREIHSYTDLVDYLNRLNGVWVSASKRLSPEVLIQLLEITGKEYSNQLQLLDPQADAMFSVAWAGEQTSKNWFHVAREYTEKWHHQQQIRDAVGIAGILTKPLFYPVMDTFMQGLPYTYRNTAAAAGTVVRVRIDTAIGGDWYLLRNEENWELTETSDTVAASITIQPDDAWKLFTKGLRKPAIENKVIITGNKELAAVVFELVAVMA